VLRVEELEAVASRMGQLGNKLQKSGAASAAIEPMRVSWLAACALLRRCNRLQAERQVSPAACMRIRQAEPGLDFLRCARRSLGHMLRPANAGH